ncbi:hypothetical protein [Corynebacterium coyleae]|uniref:hypothetical protein n=1 Tax=Corynebacterium coyleae TaxID=53374 RepID=UPI002550B818|nr:hypothetical protein [Corynebacterium coyleae]MDK8663874.1 hypothetical protein [Corynebacterium coyleae]MDK8706829.1 hypothetical protein [Corynebacterium coyleae]MDK8733676.1 hypothetical protein [Corynebacterium coyleae]MDK8892872.1 hypothetical protein [Corynebacterium coyleae]
MTSTTTRIAAYATAATLALGTAGVVGAATPANAATVAAKDKDGVCVVKLAPAEKRFIQSWFDDFKAIGDYEQARDIIAAIEQVYPGVVAENEKALKGEKAEFGKVLPEGLAAKYADAQKTMKESEPTVNRTLEAIDTDSWRVGPDTKRTETPLTAKDGDVYKAWTETPSGKVAAKSMLIDDADATAAETCTKGMQADVKYPTAKMDTDVNVPAIVGGVIAALLVIAGLFFALPHFGIKLPMLGM